MREPFRVGDESVAAGERRTVHLPLSVLSNHTPMTLPMRVLHGAQDGPTMFVSAAIHGDEIIGVEIIRRLLRAMSVRRLMGTLLCIPIVNSFGFLSHTRYLPDRRDLNRSFPGNPNGSLASQIAHLFTTEVVQRSDIGIDIHSAGMHRTNLPQIRISGTTKSTRGLAEAFGAPLVLESPIRDGSLRQTAINNKVEILVYEAGEALRFDELAVRVGVKGIRQVMRHAGMLPPKPPGTATVAVQPWFSRSSSWIRAPRGGILRAFRTTGDSVEQDEVIGVISDPFGQSDVDVTASRAGVVIGRTNLPVVNQGDALFHVATVPQTRGSSAKFEKIRERLGSDPLFDEDEII